MAGGVASLKACKSCMLVKYCNANCQRNHWPKHKKQCKQRAAELHAEALFKDPPPKEDCPICFLPMPEKMINCMSFPPATITSVPVNDYALTNVELAGWSTRHYNPCCGKGICAGCVYSIRKGNNKKCPFCKAERVGKTGEDTIKELMKRVEANDAVAICEVANFYYHGNLPGLQQDQAKGIELWTKAVALGSSYAHCLLGNVYREGGDSKKTKFHMEAAAMAGYDVERCNLGTLEAQSGNMGRAVMHWKIAASTGNHAAMQNMKIAFNQGHGVSRDALNSTLIAYNNYCDEMRSVARDAAIREHIEKGRAPYSSIPQPDEAWRNRQKSQMN